MEQKVEVMEPIGTADYDENLSDFETKYLSFRLQTEQYGFHIRYVAEIIQFQDVTPVPDLPEYVMGVINLRGRIIPVVDLKKRFGLNANGYESSACIIIMTVESTTIGIAVDAVLDVTNIGKEQIDPPPEGRQGGAHAFILGVGKSDSGITLLLNPEPIMAKVSIN